MPDYDAVVVWSPIPRGYCQNEILAMQGWTQIQPTSRLCYSSRKLQINIYNVVLGFADIELFHTRVKLAKFGINGQCNLQTKTHYT